mmetsp:Transcript_86702/g.234972  ORF Transcript_86702/g.234972 Transcript_86702/m.234972 type:complete len:481 (-) Transcript_86702:302-1744(-)
MAQERGPRGDIDTGGFREGDHSAPLRGNVRGALRSSAPVVRGDEDLRGRRQDLPARAAEPVPALLRADAEAVRAGPRRGPGPGGAGGGGAAAQDQDARQPSSGRRIAREGHAGQQGAGGCDGRAPHGPHASLPGVPICLPYLRGRDVRPAELGVPRPPGGRLPAGARPLQQQGLPAEGTVLVAGRPGPEGVRLAEQEEGRARWRRPHDPGGGAPEGGGGAGGEAHPSVEGRQHPWRRRRRQHPRPAARRQLLHQVGAGRAEAGRWLPLAGAAAPAAAAAATLRRGRVPRGAGHGAAGAARVLGHGRGPGEAGRGGRPARAPGHRARLPPGARRGGGKLLRAQRGVFSRGAGLPDGHLGAQGARRGPRRVLRRRVRGAPAGHPLPAGGGARGPRAGAPRARCRGLARGEALGEDSEVALGPASGALALSKRTPPRRSARGPGPTTPRVRSELPGRAARGELARRAPCRGTATGAAPRQRQR